VLGDELEMVWKGALYADDDFRAWFFRSMTWHRKYIGSAPRIK